MNYAELSVAQHQRAKEFSKAQTDAMVAYCNAEHDLRELQAENAKLRELVDYMTPIAWYGASERERDRLRELGIEVDE